MEVQALWLAISNTLLLIMIYIRNRKLHTSTTFRQAVKETSSRMASGGSIRWPRTAISRRSRRIISKSFSGAAPSSN